MAGPTLELVVRELWVPSCWILSLSRAGPVGGLAIGASLIYYTFPLEFCHMPCDIMPFILKVCLILLRTRIESGMTRGRPIPGPA